MIANLKGTIVSMVECTQDGEKWVNVDLDITGKFEDSRVTGKEILSECTLRIKPVFASNLRFGQSIQFTMNTES